MHFCKFSVKCNTLSCFFTSLSASVSEVCLTSQQLAVKHLPSIWLIPVSNKHHIHWFQQKILLKYDCWVIFNTSRQEHNCYIITFLKAFSFKPLVEVHVALCLSVIIYRTLTYVGHTKQDLLHFACLDKKIEYYWKDKMKNTSVGIFFWGG